MPPCEPYNRAMNGDSTLQARYDAVLRRIRTACEAAGRDPRTVTLLAVSKTFPLFDAAQAHRRMEDAHSQGKIVLDTTDL